MFTGIVEEAGTVERFEEQQAAYELVIGAHTVTADLAIGDSLAVNGCCLTVVELSERSVRFDLLEESVRLTSFQQLKSGALVNLERSLPANGRLGGHFVSGHVDALGCISDFETRGKNVYLRVEPPEEFLRWVIYKGSVALDGISLTVAEVDATGFAVWLIPHTLEVTNLRERTAGDAINVEFDLLAKYIEKIGLGQRTDSAYSRLEG
ncbi:MAG: riboflavin synthase [Opitutales bacterium]